MKKQLIVMSALFMTFSSQCMLSNMFNKAKESASSLASKAVSTVKQGASAAITKATPVIQQQASKAAATIQQQAGKAATELQKQGAVLASGIKQQSKEALEQAVIKAQEQSGALIGQASQHASNIMETGAARVGSSMERRAGAVISKIGGNTVVSVPVSSDQADLVEQEEPVVDSVAVSKAALMERFKGN